MYVFWSDRSSATSSRQSPHPRTSSGSEVIGSGLSSRPHSGESPGAWWTTGAAATTLLSSRLRSPSAVVKESTPFRSEVPQLVAPNLRVYRAVPLQSPPGESCRDHPAAADTAVDGVVLSPSVVLVGEHHRRAAAPGGRRLPGGRAWRSSPLNKRPFLRGPVRTPSVSFDEPLNKYPQQ